MLSLLGRHAFEGHSGKKPSYLESFTDTFLELNDDDRIFIKLVSIAQIFDLSVPETLVELIFGPSVVKGAADCYKGLIRRDHDDPFGGIGYHLGGPILAIHLLSKEISSEDLFYELCENLMARSIGLGNIRAGHFWRMLLHRMASNWTTVLSRQGALHIARRLYYNFKNSFDYPNPADDPLQAMSWAATLRKLGGADHATTIYLDLWKLAKSSPNEKLLTPLFLSSLLIGLKELTPNLIYEAEYLRISEILAEKFIPAAPKLSIAMGDVFIETYHAHRSSLAPESRHLLLSAAERLGRASIRFSYRHSAHNLLARLVGGLEGPYVNANGDERPNFEEALALADLAFESKPSLAAEDNLKTWQDITTHNVKARLYLAEYQRSGRFITEADWHFQRSFLGLPRNNLNASTRKQIFQLIHHASMYAYFKWKHCNDELAADQWYRNSIEWAETFFDDAPPQEVWKTYQNYTSFLTRKAVADPMAAIRILRRACTTFDSCTTSSQAKEWCAHALKNLAEGVQNRLSEAIANKQWNAVEKYGLEVISICSEIVAVSPSSQHRESAFMHLGRILFPPRTPREVKAKIASLIGLKAAAALVAGIESRIKDYWALKTFVSFVDNYPVLVDESLTGTVEEVVVATAKAAPDDGRELYALLLEWAQEKYDHRWPSKFNSRLLAKLRDIS